MPRPKGSRYQRLADYLTAQAGDEVTLSITQIELLVSATLPTSAYLRYWWRGYGATYRAGQPWRAVGWEATLTQRADDWRVRFRRQPAAIDDNSAR